jgi:integrase
VRKYKGRTLFCGGRKATREQVERRFEFLRDEADRPAGSPPAAPQTYRELLSRFLASCRDRVRTGRPKPLSERTLHNYLVTLNDFGDFVGGGSIISEVNRPDIFAAYGKRFGDWKASGFDSIVTRVGALFRWAAEMEYIDRYRPGPSFARPHKSILRDERLQLQFCFSPEEYRKLARSAGQTMRCFIGLGLYAAMNNSEVSHLAREVVDLDAKRIDFQRRKKGRIRRICPLPDDLVDSLRNYARPHAADARDEGFYFLTRRGHLYSSTRHHDGKPGDSLGRMFRKLMDSAGVELRPGRGFHGLRTTFYNACPRDYELERKIIMGRAQGTVDYDSYLEGDGSDRLRELVAHVHSKFST